MTKYVGKAVCIYKYLTLSLSGRTLYNFKLDNFVILIMKEDVIKVGETVSYSGRLSSKFPQTPLFLRAVEIHS